LWFVVVGALVALLAVLYIPVLRDLFHFQYMHLDDLVMAIFAGMASLAWFEGLKYLGKSSG
jgi:Ca2+-transporting ATPase